MNTKLRTLLFFIFLFLIDFVSYADTGEDDFEQAPDAAPIDSKIILLILAGILFAIYTFRKNRKEA